MQFRSHLEKLLRDVLKVPPPVTMVKGADDAQRDMQLGYLAADYIEMSSAVGKLYVSIAQDLVALPCNAGFQLKTRNYWHKIFDVQPGLEDEPLFRWEYVARSEVPAGKHWCRHHFQIGKVSSTSDGQRRAIEVPLGKTKLDTNRIHIPTGFVLIEYVLRFLIVEFEVPTVEGWENALDASEDQFFREFSSRTSTP